MTSTDNEESSTLPTSDDQEVVCYLCLGGGVDDASQPLRRDCACRGTDAGFVHLQCLAEYAAAKSIQARSMRQLVQPWEACPSCNQEYQNEFAVDIATKFMSSVRREYPDDTQRQVEAHMSSTPVQKREFGVTENVLLSLIGRMKEDASPIHMRYSQCESTAYNALGRIALNEGTEESARRAVVHFWKNLTVRESIGCAEGIANAKSNIAAAQSKYKCGCRNNEEVLKTSCEVYELRISEYGDEHELTISSGKIYARNLQNANPGDEARELLTILLATSKRVLGSHDSTTKEVESTLEWASN